MTFGESTQTITLIDVLYEGVSRIPSFKVTPSTLIVNTPPFGLLAFTMLSSSVLALELQLLAWILLDFKPNLQWNCVPRLRPPLLIFIRMLKSSPEISLLPNASKTLLVLHLGPVCSVAGFNCQPYSRAGAMKGIHDVRAEFVARCATGGVLPKITDCGVGMRGGSIQQSPCARGAGIVLFPLRVPQKRHSVCDWKTCGLVVERGGG